MRTVGIVAWIVAGSLAGLGAAHHLARRGAFGDAACPHLGASSVELETQRKAAVASLAGTSPAPTSSAFGLALGASRESAKKWADQRAMRCEPVDAVALRCATTTSVLGVRSDVFLRFDDDRLVGLDAVGTIVGDEPAARYRALRDTLVQNFGAPHEESIQSNVPTVGRMASVWRFRDVAVDLSLFALGGDPRLRVQLRALR